ncbi:DUF6660 family protein [Dyadobacter psychrotolerans]|uniref:DUF6660 family protein n=1 Tax=Dyadobacter psychrotolerans TaxID=2541721 RepID=UPI0035B64A2F
MKLAHYFLAIYTVLLSCIPCQDEVLMSFHDTTKITVRTASELPREQVPDLCSPFCICACCSGITIQQQVPCLPESVTFSFLKENAFVYTPQINSTNLTTIWQPPRI